MQYIFVVVCNIWMVGWSESGVCVDCEVFCGVHDVYLLCVCVVYDMCAVKLVCLCVCSIYLFCL